MNVQWSLLRTIIAGSIVGVFFHLAVGLPQEPVSLDSTSGRVHFWLTLLHNNDGESQLINAGSGLEDLGGVARFATLVRQLKQEATAQAWPSTSRRPSSSRGVIMVTSGDNFLAAPVPRVALQNGGGIRNDTIIPAGNITELMTFDILPFANFVAIVPDVSAAQFKEILENAVSRVEFTDGRFAQIAGFRFVWDSMGTAQVLDAEDNIVTEGTRIREVALDDGTMIVRDGAVVLSASALHLATIDFLARSGDQYPFRGLPFVTLGVAYQQGLRLYIEEGLAGTITAARYPAEGEGRITTVGQAAAAPTRLTTGNASLNREVDAQVVEAERLGQITGH
jgi:hypothetical protein